MRNGRPLGQTTLEAAGERRPHPCPPTDGDTAKEHELPRGRPLRYGQGAARCLGEHGSMTRPIDEYLDSAAAYRTDPAAAPPARTRPWRALIVEDNDDSREMLRELLGLWGLEIEVASDGEEGIRKALAWRPNFALIDIGLPGLDGYQLAERIRTDARGRDIVLIALTGYGQQEDRVRARQAGFRAHLVKPVDLDELSRLLDQACDASASPPGPHSLERPAKP